MSTGYLPGAHEPSCPIYIKGDEAKAPLKGAGRCRPGWSVGLYDRQAIMLTVEDEQFVHFHRPVAVGVIWRIFSTSVAGFGRHGDPNPWVSMLTAY